MAIAFAQVSIHSRSKGHSAIAASSYRSGSKLFDSRIGVTHDYSKRNGVIYSEILLPKDSDSAFSEREFLWNQVELAEKRTDAQLCKDIVIALPKELNLIQQVELAKRFATHHFVDNGIPADISIHDDKDGNPHAHILVTTRRLEKNKFSRYKARDLNPTFAKGFVVEKNYWGEQWRDMQNDYFIEKDLDLIVDLNHIISERHHGNIKDNDTHYLLTEKEILQQARQDIAKNNIYSIIEHISAQHSVFTRQDVEKLLFKTFKNSDRPQDYLVLVEQVMSHSELIELGKNDKGHLSYTTKNQYIQEAKLRDDIESMMKNRVELSSKNIVNIIQKHTLSDEQLEAFHYIRQGSQISVVIGRPGTGKSYLLKPVKEYYECHQYRVIGAALSGKVAKSLQADTGIPSSTIASLTYKLANNQLQLTNKDVVIIDEAGMVDFQSISFIVREARKAGSKVILVGDPDQLKPIHKGEIFRGIAAYTGYIELENIKRQNDLGDRLASMNLAKGNIEEAIQHYYDKQAIHFAPNTQDATHSLIQDWQENLTQANLQDSILLAFTKNTVSYLNEQARFALKDKKLLGDEDITLQGSERKLQITVGERLLFRQNDKTLDVRNGDIGTVQAIKNNHLDIQLDSGERVFIPFSYQKMDYAYALTVHKSQGMTVKHSKVLIDSKYWDRNLSFVAMTRHKESLNIYTDLINHPSIKDLNKTLSRSTTRDNVIDWPLDFATRAGFNPEQLIGRALNHIVGVGHKIKNAYNYVVNYETYLIDCKVRGYQENKEKNCHGARAMADFQDSYLLNKKNKSSIDLYQRLQKKYPLLAEYQYLIDKRKHLNGYFAERIDQKIVSCVKQLMQNKYLMEVLENKFPQTKYTFKQINDNIKVHEEIVHLTVSSH